MAQLLVDKPEGLQALVEVGQSGGYFDESRVLWDDRRHGALPAITLGGMVASDVPEILLDKDGNPVLGKDGQPVTRLVRRLTFSQARLEQHNAVLQSAADAEAARTGRRQRLARAVADIDSAANLNALKATLKAVIKDILDQTGADK